jgi:hypothetical protein
MLLHTSHTWKAPQYTMPSALRARTLGVAPAVVAGTAAAAASIAALIALVQNALDDDWSDSTVFTANMKQIHSSMLALQCIVGGAQDGQPLVDMFGNTICPGGTKPTCSLPANLLTQWQTLRDGFGQFWAAVANQLGGPSNADAQQAKTFAQSFAAFYTSLQSVCGQQGTTLPDLPAPAPTTQPPVNPTLKYAVWGFGALAVIALAVSAKSIFGKG